MRCGADEVWRGALCGEMNCYAAANWNGAYWSIDENCADVVCRRDAV